MPRELETARARRSRPAPSGHVVPYSFSLRRGAESIGCGGNRIQVEVDAVVVDVETV